MKITLENFRAQVGNQNYGEVIVGDNGQLKTVNNGWFARKFTCLFGAKTSAAQHRDVAFKLYNAVKTSLAQGRGAEGARREVLNSVALALGIEIDDKGNAISRSQTTPLKRRTIKAIIGKVDRFNLNVTKMLRDDLKVALCKEAKGLVRTIYSNSGINLTPQGGINNADDAVAFIRNHQGDIGNNAEAGRLGEANAMVGDLEILESYDPTGKNSTTALVDDLLGRCASNFIRTRLSGISKAVNLCENMWKDKRLMHYVSWDFDRALGHRAKKLGVRDREFNLSVTEMKRLVNRQFEKILASVADDPDFQRESEADGVKKIVALCVKTMTDADFRANFNLA